MRKRKYLLSLIIVCIAIVMSGCKNDKEITVVSREDGSGTRGAFVESVELYDKQGYDAITNKAEITNCASVAIQSVITDEDAIGYVSIGAIPQEVKAVKIDGVSPTGDNVNLGKYKIARSFNIVEKELPNKLAEDFKSYILSNQGQEIVKETGFVALKGNGNYEKKEIKGKLVVAGSTSVGPLMEVLAERYMTIHPDVSIEIQQTGSSAGIEATLKGACNVGMSSRELKESEKEKGLKETVIAQDGIAVIVNKENDITNLNLKDVRDIFSGVISSWNYEGLGNAK